MIGSDSFVFMHSTFNPICSLCTYFYRSQLQLHGQCTHILRGFGSPCKVLNMISVLLLKTPQLCPHWSSPQHDLSPVAENSSTLPSLLTFPLVAAVQLLGHLNCFNHFGSNQVAAQLLAFVEPPTTLRDCMSVCPLLGILLHASRWWVVRRMWLPVDSRHMVHSLFLLLHHN